MSQDGAIHIIRQGHYYHRHDIYVQKVHVVHLPWHHHHHHHHHHYQGCCQFVVSNLHHHHRHK